MATTLIVLMAVFGSGALFYLFVWQPISEDREQLAEEEKLWRTAQDNLTATLAQIGKIESDDPRLKQWQRISLPPRNPEGKKAGVTLEEQKKRHERRLGVQYERYLSNMLTNNGFTETVVTPRTVDKRSIPKLKGEEPVYNKLAFGATARGELEAVVKSLREFHQAHLLHSIRNLTLTVAQPRGRVTPKAGLLDLTMQVEALIVNGADDRKDMLPEKLNYPLQVLAATERKYSSMLDRNMFTGVVRSFDPSDPDGTGSARSENKKDVLSFVKLTMLCYDTKNRRWHATLYDQGKGGDELFVNRIWNDLKIEDHAKHTMLDAKVVLIDEKQLIFLDKESKKYYRMQCGDFVYDALGKALSKEELKALGINP
jgi:hypothetical protein